MSNSVDGPGDVTILKLVDGAIYRTDRPDCPQPNTYSLLSNVDNLKGLFMGSARSEVHIENSSATGLDTYDARSSKLKSYVLDRVTFNFNQDADANNDLSIETGIQRTSVVNCVFDGTAYNKKHGKLLLLKARAHHASGNIAINCGPTGADGYDSGGRQAVVPKVGSPLNYKTSEPEGSLLPTWSVTPTP